MKMKYKVYVIDNRVFSDKCLNLAAEASFRGLGGHRPQGRRKRKEERKKEKKEKKKGTLNNVKLLHIKCCFFQFFNSPVALKNKKISAPKKKLK